MLLLVGGGAIVAAGVGAVEASRTPSRAMEPWSLAGSYGEIRRNALSWALLAPNPHNLQPWRAQLIGEDSVALFLDPERSLPQTDPFGRQIVIGLGCFIELMRMAAAQSGYGVDLDFYPEGEGAQAPVVRARFRPNAAQPDALFVAAQDRRTNRLAYDVRPLPSEETAILSEYGVVVSEPEAVANLRALAKEAWDIELMTPRAWKESVDELRFGARQIDATPDGLAVRGGFINLLAGLGLVTREAQLPQGSMGWQTAMDAFNDAIAATPAFVVQVSEGNTRRDQLDAGSRWMRLSLAAAQRGLSLQPLSQALQEYPEMAAPYARIHALYAQPGQTVQMLARVGFAPPVPAAPRWRLEEKLVV
ncbi:MAG: twin-arginine translocation pathway signal protein [Aestuariivirga sp.]|uniref:Acg family FMN-binding oxidoreductase n=1 Tax=Aestuariivirga sp. TaxID=2650926 RepID=UPI0025C5EC2E|nr:twin-arginine translocation pathway signal protein [Aestuariivirga sp.]MCA3562680.1 twin-arginine translocation pathway signal protein [Aestuariivirga sp.]